MNFWCNQNCVVGHPVSFGVDSALSATRYHVWSFALCVFDFRTFHLAFRSDVFFDDDEDDNGAAICNGHGICRSMAFVAVDLEGIALCE